VQEIGRAYWTGDDRRGMPVGADANGVLIEIKNGTLVP
jgi:hypothetical protein